MNEEITERILTYDELLELKRFYQNKVTLLRSRLQEWEELGRQFLETADSMILQCGSDVLPKGWLSSANRLRKTLSAEINTSDPEA